MAAIELQDLTVCYHRHPAVHHVSGRFDAGSLTALVGPNGAGKTTLLKTIAGLMRPESGRVERSISGGPLAYLPQQAEVDRTFPVRVMDMVELGFWRRLGVFGGVSARQRRQAADALAAVGLSGFEGRSIASLSAGQFQRVLFARVLLQDAALILLDEPFNAIDARTTADLLRVVSRWHGEGRTVIAVLHDLEQVKAHFPRTLLMARTAVDWGETAQVLRAGNLFRARQMAEAWDDSAAECTRESAA
ncbi:zinc ABC transporter ATP-binding protein AztA [Aquisalimonas asiatica]|uniref:Zinc/manganese transport system ATP-binding protein n=1 Tax=Aquisalimonas asiatica TaxID=406100 RepID=A0A1H8SY42_9GAMM|nr:zinc ABC transporter ATP-binding protein AztA [Aquisalimonas asiatica]SEO83258.1 zinc/manganese transport system ATP-binding protein [Aquisalimonas asiatica]